jgi:hypothetical protein
MTLIDRRSLIKVGATAGFAMACGGTSKQEAAQTTTSAPPSPPAAQASGASNEFGMQFSGLFLFAFKASDNRLRVVMPVAEDSHTRYVAVDLQYVELLEDETAKFDFAVGGPDGQHLGVWKLTGNGDITLTGVSGTDLSHTGKEEVTKCPENETKWRSISWAADLSQIHGMPVKPDDEAIKKTTVLTLTSGLFGSMMPHDPDLQIQRFVVVDADGKDVLNAEGNHFINQPLASGIFYRATTTGTAVLTLPGGAVIRIKGGGRGVNQVFFSHLPKTMKKLKEVPRPLKHFDHYRHLIKPSKAVYPGIGLNCGVTPQPVTRETAALMRLSNFRDIEPIYCPPAIVFEA